MFPSKYNNMVLFLAATMAFGMTLRDRRTGGLVHLLRWSIDKEANEMKSPESFHSKLSLLFIHQIEFIITQPSNH